MSYAKTIVAVLILVASGVASSAVAQHPIEESRDSLFERDMRSSDTQYDRLLEKKAALQKLSDAIENEEAKINQETRRLNSQSKQLAERGAALDQETYSFQQHALPLRQESQAIDARETMLKRESAAIESLRLRVRSNADVRALNQRIHAYNAQLLQFKARIQQFNAALRQRQQMADRLKLARRQIQAANVDHGVQTAQLERGRQEHERLRDNYNVQIQRLKDDFAEWRQRRLALESKQEQRGTSEAPRGTLPRGHVRFKYDNDAPKVVGSTNR